MRTQPPIARLPRTAIALTCATAWVCAAGAQNYMRAIIHDQIANESPLPTIPPSLTDALLQAKIFISPDGTYWAAQVITLEGATTNRAAVSGTRNGVDFALGRGQNMPGLEFAFEASAVGIDTELLVNNAGQVSISGNLPGNTADETIIRYSRSTGQYEFVVREGNSIPGISGESHGGSLDQRTMLSDGRVLFRDGTTSGALPSTQDEFIFLSNPTFSTIAQGGVFTPGNQSENPPLVMTDVEAQYACSADGSSYILRGILQRATNNIAVVVNGNVVLEQGQILPGALGSQGVATSITDVGMSPAGDWFITGRGTTGSAQWLIKNNEIVFTADTGLPGGLPGEQVTQIIGVNITTQGVLQYSVFTSFSRSLVIVDSPFLSEPFIALQNGDPVDIDGDGDPFNDGVFVSFFFSTALGDDGTLYVISRNTGPGAPDALGWVPVEIAPPCPGDVNGDDVIDLSDLAILLANFGVGEGATRGQGDLDGDGDVDLTDLSILLALFGSTCA